MVTLSTMESGRSKVAALELVNETDHDLLVYMAMADAEPEYAQAAWEVFYGRHAGYLHAVCCRAYGQMLAGETGVADVVAETFRIAYQQATKFDAAGITCPERLRLRVRAWLGWIARRLVRDLLRGRSRSPAWTLELDEWQRVPEADRPAAASDEQRLVRQALEALDEREQLVVRTTLQWYRADSAHQRLPNDVAADLARTLQTTPENLRQIRRRAMMKITDFMAAHRTDTNTAEQSDE